MYPSHSGVMSWPIPTAKRSVIASKKVVAGSARSDLVALLALIVSIVSIGLSAWQGVTSSKEARIDRTTFVVQQFLTSNDTLTIAKAISQKTKQGTDYSDVLVDVDLKSDVNNYLNQLEHIAEGVNNERYDEEVVFNNLAVIVFKLTKAHLKGESGTTPSGQSWVANQRNEPPFPSRDNFASVTFPVGRGVSASRPL